MDRGLPQRDRLTGGAVREAGIAQHGGSRWFTAIPFALAMAAADGAGAGIPVDETATCPIGGAEFTYTSTLSMSIMGRRLDMKAATSAPWVKWPLICPDNGFPIFKRHFSDDEIETLGAIVHGDAFQRARQANVPSYMLYFIRKALGETDYALANALLVAIWDAEEEAPELFVAYMRQAIAHYDAFLDGHDARDDEWWTAQILAANFDRKLGNFDAALARLAKLPVSALPEDSPIRLFVARIAGFAQRGDSESQWLE